MAPKVSIIVPLAGGPAQALRCFEGIAVQPDDPAHEIIVVDDASIGLEPLLSQLAGDVEVLRNERRLGLASSARRGAEHARGEVIVFIRDAAAPAAGWLAPLAAALGDPAVGFAASATVDAADAADAPHSPVAAWSFAVRTADFHATDSRIAGLPGLPGPLLAGALSLSLAERGLRAVTVASSRVSAPGARTVARAAPPASTPS